MKEAEDYNKMSPEDQHKQLQINGSKAEFENLTKEVSKVKSQLDSIKKVMDEVPVIQAKLKNKGYPDTMGDYLHALCDKHRKTYDAVLSEWVASKQLTAQVSKETLVESGKHLRASFNAFDREFKIFKDNQFSDCKKITG